MKNTKAKTEGSSSAVSGPYRQSVSAVRISSPYRRSVSAVRISGPYRQSVSAVRVGSPCRDLDLAAVKTRHRIHPIWNQNRPADELVRTADSHPDNAGTKRAAARALLPAPKEAGLAGSKDRIS